MNASGGDLDLFLLKADGLVRCRWDGRSENVEELNSALEGETVREVAGGPREVRGEPDRGAGADAADVEPRGGEGGAGDEPRHALSPASSDAKKSRPSASCLRRRSRVSGQGLA